MTTNAGDSMAADDPAELARVTKALINARNRTSFGPGVLAWPGIIKGLRVAQQNDLDDLLAQARGDDELRNLLARAWAAGRVSGWDDRTPGGVITTNPFDEGWH